MPILEALDRFESWESLLYKQNKSNTERLLIQATAMLSTQPNYVKMTPHEIYEEICVQTQGLYK